MCTFVELLAAFHARPLATVGGAPTLTFAIPPEWEAGGAFCDGCGPREVEFWHAVRAAGCFELEQAMAASMLERLLVQNKYLAADGRFRAWPSRDRHQLWAVLWLALRLVPGRAYGAEELDRLLGASLVDPQRSLVVAMAADLERRALVERTVGEGGASSFAPSRSQLEFVLDGDKLFAIRAAVASNRPWWALPIAAQHVAAPRPPQRPPARHFRCVLLDPAGQAAAAERGCAVRFVAGAESRVAAPSAAVVVEGAHSFRALEAAFDAPVLCSEAIVTADAADADARVPPFRIECRADASEWSVLQVQCMPTAEEMCNAGRGSVRCFLPHAVPMCAPPNGALALFAPLLDSGLIKRWPSKLKQQRQACLFVALHLLPERSYSE